MVSDVNDDGDGDGDKPTSSAVGDCDGVDTYDPSSARPIRFISVSML